MLPCEEIWYCNRPIPRYRLVVKFKDGFVKMEHTDSLLNIYEAWKWFVDDDECYYNVITTVEDDKMILGYQLPYIPVKKKVSKKRMRG